MGLGLAAALLGAGTRLADAVAWHFFLLPPPLQSACFCPRDNPLWCFVVVVMKVYGQLAGHPC